jgi:antitoxin Phd
VEIKCTFLVNLMYILAMKMIPLSDARRDLPSLVDAAMAEPQQITRHGKPAAVLISPSMYERLLEAIEDAEDLKAIEESMADTGPSIPWAQVKKELGLV